MFVSYNAQFQTGSVTLELIGSCRGRRTLERKSSSTATPSICPQLAIYLESITSKFSFVHTRQGDLLGDHDSLSFALWYGIF